jgi:hypothetical protein
MAHAVHAAGAGRPHPDDPLHQYQRRGTAGLPHLAPRRVRVQYHRIEPRACRLRCTGRRCAALLAALLAALPPLAGAAAPLDTLKSPDVEISMSDATFTGPGADAANNHCPVCHSPDHVRNQPALPREAWEEVIHKMITAYKAPRSRRWMRRRSRIIWRGLRGRNRLHKRRVGLRLRFSRCKSKRGNALRQLTAQLLLTRSRLR